jgi:hypothetical protein
LKTNLDCIEHQSILAAFLVEAVHGPKAAAQFD